MPVELEQSYVLHLRPFRESSQLVEAITRTQGRVGLVARGARRPRSRWRGILRPFQPLRLGWVGKGELGTLCDVEQAPVSLELTGDNLLAGFYLNELLMCLAGRNDPHPELFAHYSRAVGELAEARPQEPVLRTFELEMLAELGYEVNLVADGRNHAPLEPDRFYAYSMEDGPVRLSGRNEDGYRGSDLLAISRREFDGAQVQRSARRLLRKIIDYHLGDRQLRTRAVLRDMRRHV